MNESMFHTLLLLVTGRPAHDNPGRFVEDIRPVGSLPVRARNARVEWLILICWLAIAVKCWLIVWVVGRYHMPFSPFWVNAPTVVFALLCTAVYFGRD